MMISSMVTQNKKNPNMNLNESTSFAGPPSLAKGLIMSAKKPSAKKPEELKSHKVIMGKRAPRSGPKPRSQDEAKAELYKVNKELPLHIEALPLSERPMMWNDIPEFATRHGRTIADIVYDLALLTSHAYAQKTKKRTVVPMDLEILVHLYDMYPSSCGWARPDIREAFEFLYGAKIREFSGASEDVARLAVGRRYARLLGRVGTAQYRWLAEEGKVTRRLENIVSKIQDIALTGSDPGTVFETLSKRCWALRGVDIDKMAPMPTAESVIKPPGTRGRRISENKKNRPVLASTYEGGAFD